MPPSTASEDNLAENNPFIQQFALDYSCVSIKSAECSVTREMFVLFTV